MTLVLRGSHFRRYLRTTIGRYFLALSSVSLFASVMLTLGSPSAAQQDPEVILKLSEAVSRMCSVPSERGSYFQVEGAGEVGAGAGLILRFVEGNLKGKITEREWQGIQEVLEEDRSTDRISSRDCVLKLTPTFLNAFGLSPESQSLLQKETKMQEALASDNPAGRLVAFREAFKSVDVFFVDLTPESAENSSSSGQELKYEQSISRNIKTYDFGSGQFRDEKRQDFYALTGQVHKDSITFRNNYCSGNLRYQPGTWTFRGPVSCAHGKYEGVFYLK